MTESLQLWRQQSILAEMKTVFIPQFYQAAGAAGLQSGIDILIHLSEET